MWVLLNVKANALHSVDHFLDSQMAGYKPNLGFQVSRTGTILGLSLSKIPTPTKKKKKTTVRNYKNLVFFLAWRVKFKIVTVLLLDFCMQYNYLPSLVWHKATEMNSLHSPKSD